VFLFMLFGSIVLYGVAIFFALACLHTQVRHFLREDYRFLVHFLALDLSRLGTSLWELAYEGAIEPHRTAWLIYKGLILSAGVCITEFFSDLCSLVYCSAKFVQGIESTHREAGFWTRIPTAMRGQHKRRQGG
jgi:hypothetical protein